ncbi:complement C1r subcomponent isoform X1 [Bufo bufo]|uniref:complement C1r subcomponent isoform X1 n=1 Tax=Bufo bufo TaxID=8384 RepID=UPI001ABE6294|nr:complement C1r subcomponent isoform X1 [Bufo bufo]
MGKLSLLCKSLYTERKRIMLLWVLLLFGTAAFSTAKTPQHGLISSPNYPKTYPNNQHNTWNITVNQGFHISLKFLVFDLEPSDGCNYDYVKVFDDKREMGQFCGPKSSRSHPGYRLFITHGNQMKIEFHSDFSNEENGSAVFYKGFQAFYRAVDDDECASPNDNSLTWIQPCQHFCHNYVGGYFCSCLPGYQLESDNRSCKAQCSDHLFMEESGYISSPGYPQPYPPDLNCTYRIRLEEGMQISLEFIEIFDIDYHPRAPCPYDTLKIFEGHQLVRSLCGRRAPEMIQTKSHEVDILFQTDDSGDNRGWKIFYTSEAVQCPKPVTLDEFSTVSPMQEVYRMQDYFVLSCRTGYRLVEQEGRELSVFTAVCQKDGTWHRPVPRCEIVSCQEPEVLRNGRHMFLTEPKKVTYQSKIVYSCDEPYYKIVTHKGSDTFTCLEDRVWKDENGEQQIPICLPVCGQPQNPVAGLSRIIDGKEAENGNFPWQAFLKSPGRAGGVLIDEKWVLTAAHVLKPDRSTRALDINNLHVFLGDVDVNNLVKNGLAKVKAFHIYPDYTTESHDHDIALIELENPVTMGSNVSPICLPENSEVSLYESGRVGYVSGFGITEENKITDHLHYVILPVAARDKCQKQLVRNQAGVKTGKQKFTENMFCAGFSEDENSRKDSCQGDSGGAFAVENRADKKWVATGLVSWGIDCGRGYGYYTKVVNYIDWIKSHIGR